MRLCERDARFVLVFATIAGAAGCGGAPPPPPAPPPEPVAVAVPPPQEAEPDDGMRLSGDGVLGTMDDDAIARVLQPRLEEFSSCLNGHRKLGYIGGSITLKYRIARDGTVKRLGFASDLGAWDVERCVLKSAAQVSFPRPRGGEAEFEYPAKFRPRQRYRVWGEDRISADVHRQEKELRECPGGPESYALTFFIGAGGKTTSVGFSSPEPWGRSMEAFADCIVAKAARWRFIDPLGEVTKATYQFE